jgi:hypothetical protein
VGGMHGRACLWLLSGIWEQKGSRRISDSASLEKPMCGTVTNRVGHGSGHSEGKILGREGGEERHSHASNTSRGSFGIR